MKKAQKKFSAFTASFLICALTSGILVSAAASGDVNGDGKFSASDIRLFSDYMTGAKTTGFNAESADFNGDNAITIVDYIMAKNALTEGSASTENDYKTTVKLNGNTITASGDCKPDISGSSVTINSSGTYYFEGKLDGGQIAVDVPKTDEGTVKLVFRGVELTGAGEAPLYIINADKTSLTLESGTVNIIRDGNEFAETQAVIHAKDDFTVKGDGRLEIYAGTHHAVHCSNDLKINGADIYIETEAEDALRGGDSVTVKSGNIEINSSGDGIKSTKGNVDIEGGTVKIKAKSDAIQAETKLNITGGDITACGGRGLTAPESVNITGGSVLASATDSQCSTLSDVSSGTMLLNFTKEWAKNNPVTLIDGTGKTVFDKNTLKKFSYVLVSDEKLSGNCTLYTGGIKMASSGSSTFKPGTPAEYSDVNNSSDNEVLYADMFDAGVVHSIMIDMDEAEWQDLKTNARDEEYHNADITIDGTKFKNAAIRTKGFSSLQQVAASGSEKFSLRISLDKNEKYQNYKGLTEFCINNFYGDPSAMRDKLCYDAMENLNAYCPQTAYTDVYMNGNLFSFYLLCEVPSDTMGERFSTDNEATLYKADEITCTFQPNQNLSGFSVKYGPDETMDHISYAIKELDKVTPDNYKFIENTLDVPSFLKGFAVNAYMCNYDSYNGSMAHNYYLLWNDDKLSYVGWDYNLSLGAFMGGSASVNSDITTALYSTSASSRPLVSKLLAVPEYYEMYVGYVKEIAEMYSDPEASAEKYASLIREHVKADTRYLFTADDFEKNIARSAEGLKVDETQTGGGNWGGFGGGDWGGFGGGNWGDFGGGNWGGFGGGDWGGFGGFGGGFGGNNVSVTDFLIKRLEVVKNALNF